jgi:hypothetical protein
MPAPIQNSTRIYDFAAFIGNLQQAADGVTFFKGGQTAVATAFLITDTLLLVPGSLFPQTDNIIYTCFFNANANESIQLERLDAVDANLNPDTADTFQVALFRLPFSMPQKNLSFFLDKPENGADVFVLQHLGDAQLKISSGQLVYYDEKRARYTSATRPGASGAPIVTAGGKLLGMHYAKYPDKGSEQEINEGLSVSAILAQLKTTPQWNEIASYHNLVTIETRGLNTEQAPEQETDAAQNRLLIQAALEWYFNPEDAAYQKVADVLKPLVVEVQPEKWTMKLEERQRIIAGAGQLKMLQKAGKKKKTADAGDAVVQRILEGPPYYTAKLTDAELPYWLQAVRWFGDGIPGLPAPAAINLELEQRRVRSRLRIVAPADFRGREDELKKMNNWYEDTAAGPLAVIGIGGVGKSALVSKFILDRPVSTVFFWLDFDRADLSPNKAESVLSIIAQQAYVQIEGFKKMEWSNTDWRQQTRDLGAAIAAVIPATYAPLMVLDGFEVAQQVKKYNEIWQVLEDLMLTLPTLKIIVSGRAPVASLQINQRNALMLELKGMDPESAKEWLKIHGVNDETVLQQLVNISKGIPLVLKLAVRLLEEEGNVFELPEKLPQAMVEGYLYQRILDRVIDPLLHPLAKDVLVVRTVTPGMLQEVFSDSLPKDIDITEVFDRLMREMGLVNETQHAAASLILTGEEGVLHVRSEVRLAALKLIEQDDAARVKEIDLRAVAWFKKQDLEVPANRAELIYHYLRLGDTKTASQLWRDDCTHLLAEVDTEFKEAAPKTEKWVAKRLKQAASPAMIDVMWEQEALVRIKDNMMHGLTRPVEGILQERNGRSEASPLLIYDAWLLMQHDAEEAEKLLADAPPQTGAVQLQRNLMLSLMAFKRGDRITADRYLDEIENAFTEDEKNKWNSLPLLVRAARIQLQVYLDKEVALFTAIKNISEQPNSDVRSIIRLINQFFIDTDLILPALCEEFSRNRQQYESLHQLLAVPYGENGLHELRSLLNRKWKDETAIKFERLPENKTAGAAVYEKQYQQLEQALKLKVAEINGFLNTAGIAEEDVVQLALAGAAKWHLATKDLFISKAANYLTENKEDRIASRMAVAGALAALRGEQLEFTPYFEKAPPATDFFIQSAARNFWNEKYELRPSNNVLERAHSVLNNSAGAASGYLNNLIDTSHQAGLAFSSLPLEWLRQFEHPDIFSTLLCLLAPHPLQVLCRQVLGIPDNIDI